MSSRELHLNATLALPLDMITDTFGILGIRGSGKTNTAAVLVEETLKAGQQVCVIDPTDAWTGLKSSKDGTKPGFPVVIFGGRHGDVPLEEDAGSAIADFIVDERASVVLSMRHFENHAAERRVVRDLCRRLYYRKGQQDTPTPLLVVIDEAHLYAPQRVDGEGLQCLGAVQTLVRQGRSSGFGVVLIDQRAASVSKDVLTQVETLIVHRTKGPQDRKALKEWTEQQDDDTHAKQFLDTLAGLKKGEAWVWSTGFLTLFQRVQIRERETFDSSFTPRAGVERVTQQKLAAVDVAALKAKFAATIEKQKADDPTVLRARIAELERQPQLQPKRGDDAPIVSELNARILEINVLRAELADEWARGFGAGQLSERDSLRVKMPEWLDGEGEEDTAEVMTEMQRYATILKNRALSVQSFAEYLNDPTTLAPMPRPATSPPAARENTARGAKPAAKTVTKPASSSVPTSAPTASTAPTVPNEPTALTANEIDVQTAILNAIAFYMDLDMPSPSRAQIAAYIGYHPRTPTFVHALDSLRDQRLLEMDRGIVSSTLSGLRRATLTDRERPKTLSALHDVWLAKFGNTLEREVLTVLIQRRSGTAITRQDLANLLHYHPRTPTFVDALKKLETLDLVQLPRSAVAPGEALFPKALAGARR